MNKGEIIVESAVKFVRIFAGMNGDFPSHADLFSKNAALYGVDPSQRKGN